MKWLVGCVVCVLVLELQAALLPDETPQAPAYYIAPHSSPKSTSPAPESKPTPKSTPAQAISAESKSLESSLAESKPTQTTSFQEAYGLLLEQSDGIKAQSYNLQRAKTLAQGAKLSFLPEINASALYMHVDKPIQEKLPIDSAALPPNLAPMLGALNKPIVLLDQNIIIGALTIIYPLYTGGARVQAIKLATIAHKDAQEALRLKKLASFEELANIYYGAVLARNIEQLLESSQHAASAHYQNALALEKAAQIAHLEVLAALVGLDNADTALRQARNASSIAKLTLDSALKSEITPIASLELSVKPLRDESYFVEKTLTSYPALRSLDLKIASAKSAKTLALAPFLPQVVAFGGAYANNANHALLMRAIPTWNLGLAANLSLITPQARVQKYQAAKLTQLEAQSLATQAREDISLLVRKTYRQAVSAREEYQSTSHSIALARENLKLQEHAFKQGLATSAQVLDAQSALQNALVEQQRSAFKAIVALARLCALSDSVGEFYELVR